MKNQIVRAKCEDMTIEGHGVCKVDGLVIFVKGMIIGEEAMIKIIAHKKNLAYAIIDEFIVKSPHRITSSCAVAYKCGGCDLRHIKYEYQLELKKKWLSDTLRNVGDITYPMPDIIASPLSDRYRNKVQVPVSDGKMGFYRTNSHDVIEYDDCLIQSKRANGVLSYLKKRIFDDHVDSYFRHILIKEGFVTGEMMVALILRQEDFNGRDTLVADLVKTFPYISSVIVNVNDKDTNVILGDKEVTLYGSSYIVDELDGIMFQISLKSFYQINQKQAIDLYKEIKDKAHIDKDTRILDLYSGIGTIALFLARYAKEVIGVEVIKEAVENAKENALINHIDNAHFYYDDAKNDMGKYMDDIDLVVVDPPRKGLNNKLIDTIIQKSVKEVVYVSCNPATLARDLAIFLEGGYKINSIQGFDMFPHTTHIETVVLLSKLKTDKHIDVEF